MHTHYKAKIWAGVSSIATSGARILSGYPEKPRAGPQTTSLQASWFKPKNPEASTFHHFVFTVNQQCKKPNLGHFSLPCPFLVVLIKVGYMEKRPKPIGMLGLEGFVSMDDWLGKVPPGTDFSLMPEQHQASGSGIWHPHGEHARMLGLVGWQRLPGM